jgi:nitroreductase
MAVLLHKRLDLGHEVSDQGGIMTAEGRRREPACLRAKFCHPAAEGSMNETIRLLSTRRSVAPQLLSGAGPSAQELETLLTIAARVPDHGRLVPWRFIVIEGDARHRVGDVIAAAFLAAQPDADEPRVAPERERLARAPLVVAVVSRARPHVKIPEWEQVLSAGAVCMNLVVAANAMGYASSWLTEWYAFDRQVLDALGLAPDEAVAGFVHIGRPAEAPPERPRPSLSEIVTRL